MIRILFICHGNICRSPMAEFMFKDMIRKENLQDCFHVDSAATSYEEIGNDMHYNAKVVLQLNGVKYDYHQARRVTESDYDSYDYLIVMDRYNLSNLKRIIRDDPQHKIMKLLGEEDIDDPWYTGKYEKAYKEINEGLIALLDRFKENELSDYKGK